MNKEQLKELNYPIVVGEGGVILAQDINDFQEGLFEELVDCGILTQDIGDIIDYNILEDKYSYAYEYIIDEDDLLSSYELEDLEI